MSDQPEAQDIAAAATELQESFEEMSTNLDELLGQMREVADGYAEFGQSTRSGVESSATDQSRIVAADD